MHAFTLPDGVSYYLVRAVSQRVGVVPSLKPLARRLTVAERDVVVGLGLLEPSAGLVSVVPSADADAILFPVISLIVVVYCTCCVFVKIYCLLHMCWVFSSAVNA